MSDGHHFELPKSFIAHKDGNIILTAAEKSGWHVTVPFDKATNFAEISKGSLFFRLYRGTVAVNSSVSASISANKYLTHLVLKDRTPFVTQPRLLLISEITDAILSEYLAQYHKVVVKPVDANEGEGVTTSLTTLADTKAAIAKVVELGYPSILLENHIETINEYRIIIWKGKVIDILRRIPAYVIGDGTSTIEELVMQKNQYRAQHFQDIFAAIKMDVDYHHFLKNNGLQSQTILTKDRYLTLETTCNLAQGGETERIDLESVHPDYLQLFHRVYEATGLNHCGIDLISPNLTDQPQVGKTAINELNGAPAAIVAFYADLTEGRPFYGAQTYLAAIEADPPTL